MHFVSKIEHAAAAAACWSVGVGVVPTWNIWLKMKLQIGKLLGKLKILKNLQAFNLKHFLYL